MAIEDKADRADREIILIPGAAVYHVILFMTRYINLVKNATERTRELLGYQPFNYLSHGVLSKAFKLSPQ